MRPVRASELEPDIPSIDKAIEKKEALEKLGIILKEQFKDYPSFGALIDFCMDDIAVITKENYDTSKDPVMFVLQKIAIVESFSPYFELMDQRHVSKNVFTPEWVKKAKIECIKIASLLTVVSEKVPAESKMKRIVTVLFELCNVIDPEDHSLTLSQKMGILLFAEQYMTVIGQEIGPDKAEPLCFSPL